jgi:hypothetical protein
MSTNEEYKKKESILQSLKQENEVKDQEVSLEEKKAAIRRAKKENGRDWKKVLGMIKVNKEVVQSLHSMGGGGGSEGNRLRDLNDPTRWKVQGG